MVMTLDQAATPPDGIDVDAWMRHALLSVTDMASADRATIAAGTPGYDLMQAAGEAVAQAVCDRFETGTAAVLCGPGNNGGDGFVAARVLATRGWTVRLGLLGEVSALGGDAKLAAQDWTGTTEPLSPDLLDGADVVIDAVFGAGLSRAPEGVVAETLAAIGERPVIAVDVPTGTLGDSGVVLDGGVQQALATVSFFRGKPGHHLLPGRVARGELLLTDIGIADAVLDDIRPAVALNDPSLWGAALPRVTPYSHKYTRGHVIVAGGPELIGAGCLATRAAQRAGAGIVTVAAPVQQGPLYRLALESAVVRSLKDTRAFIELLEGLKAGCVVIGPGLGLNTPGGHEKVLAVLRTHLSVVLDADALTMFAESPDSLFKHANPSVLMTPHDGEFRRLFPDLADMPDKVERATRAAERANAVILLKGYDSVIADPGGYAVINGNAPATLATAGAGDVLSGTAAALIAGGMPVFAAGCAAAYLNGAAASAVGNGLIASDLPDRLPGVIDTVRAGQFS